MTQNTVKSLVSDIKGFKFQLSHLLGGSELGQVLQHGQSSTPSCVNWKGKNIYICVCMCVCVCVCVSLQTLLGYLSDPQQALRSRVK